MDEANEFRAASYAQGEEGMRRQDTMSAIMIYTTFPSESEAKNVGRALVERGLAACVNIFPQMIAIFSWQGKVEEAAEAAMFVKTTTERADEVLAEIKRLHSYSVPSRVILPIIGGAEDYLDWIAQECRKEEQKVTRE
jgi:periplasmic divalent cation tolerance protein